MKRVRAAALFAAAAVCAMYGLAFSTPAQALDAGAEAPAFSLPAGKTSISLESYKGRWVYLDFWASWCGPCKQSFPWMNEMHDKYASRGLQVVAVNVDAKAADAERFLAATPARFAIAYDAKGDTPKLYGIKAMPTSFLIDPKGRIQLIHAGFRDTDRAALEARIAGALGKGVSP